MWSAGREKTLAYPARYLFRFLGNHGLLRVGGSPQWYSIADGSRVYVERLAGLLQDVRVSHAVTDVTRRADGVQIRDVTGQVTRVDRVVIAAHADRPSPCSPTRATRRSPPSSSSATRPT